MIKNELKRPLLQSAVVLLVIFLLIGFVAGSNAQSVFGGIASIFKGFFFSVLFIIALILAVVVSVVLLIGIFFGAVALHSPERSKFLFANFKARVSSLLSSLSCCQKECDASEEAKDCVKTGQNQVNQTTPNSSEEQPLATDKGPDNGTGSQLIEFSKRLHSLELQVQRFQTSNESLMASVSAIEARVDILPQTDFSAAINEIESTQQKMIDNFSQVSAALEACKSQLTDVSSTLDLQQKSISSLQNSQETLSDLVADIQQSQDAEPDASDGDQEFTGMYRIFSYLENDADKEQLEQVVKECLNKEMTHAEIDEYLSNTLPESVYAEVKAHPSLTRDFIRGCKK